jgi:hypothetical protein
VLKNYGRIRESLEMMHTTLPAATPNTNTDISHSATITFLSTPLTLLNEQIEQSHSQNWSQSYRTPHEDHEQQAEEDNEEEDDLYVSVAPATDSHSEDEKGDGEGKEEPGHESVPSSYQPSPHSRLNRYHDRNSSGGKRRSDKSYQPDLYQSQSQPMYEDSDSSEEDESSDDSRKESSAESNEEQDTRRGVSKQLFLNHSLYLSLSHTHTLSLSLTFLALPPLLMSFSLS